MVTTMNHLGTALDRARAAASVSSMSMHLPTSWRGGSVVSASTGCGTSGLAAYPTTWFATETNCPADTATQLIKRAARHLGTRST